MARRPPPLSLRTKQLRLEVVRILGGKPKAILNSQPSRVSPGGLQGKFLFSSVHRPATHLSLQLDLQPSSARGLWERKFALPVSTSRRPPSLYVPFLLSYFFFFDVWVTGHMQGRVLLMSCAHTHLYPKYLAM